MEYEGMTAKQLSELLKGRLSAAEKTYIFLDEVQECKEIVTAIKFLVDESSYRRISRLSEIDFDIFATKTV